MNCLHNLSVKLKRGESINVAYIGGSVTEGYGASNKKEKSWPTLVSRWISEKYGVEVNSHNEGIGGTSSYLANFRFDTDIAPHKPDLFFIEFAVNDYYENFSYEAVARNSESLISRAYELNPYMDIVYVFTFDLHEEKNDYEQLRAHRDVADKYGLLSIKMSEFMYPYCETTGDSIHDHYIDWVHPNDYGYQTYAQIIHEQLEANIESEPQDDMLIKHQFLGDEEKLITGAHFVYADTDNVTNAKDWIYEHGVFSYLGGRYGGRLKSDIVGSSFDFKFNGKNLGIFYGADVNRGKVSISVDGGKAIVLDGYRWTSNPKELEIISFSTAGEHTAKFTLLEEKNEKSNSHFFEIGVFFVS